MTTRFFISFLALLMATPALAEQGRYALYTTENGYVRIDTQTGDMALCIEDGTQIICRAAADERAAFQQQLQMLEDRIDALETAMGTGVTQTPLLDSEGLPSVDEFERSLDYMERFFDRFRGIIEDFDTPPTETP